MPLKTSETVRMLTLLGGALLCALVANALAPAQRRLSWRGWVPPATRQAPATSPLPAASNIALN